VADFKKLLVWEKAHALMIAVHGIAQRIRRSYDVALISESDSDALISQVIEARRMLHGLIRRLGQSLNTNRRNGVGEAPSSSTQQADQA